MLPKLKFRNCLILLLGSIIQAVGIYNIHAMSQVTEGGVLGLTLLLQHWFRISPAVSSFLLNLVSSLIFFKAKKRCNHLVTSFLFLYIISCFFFVKSLES